MFLRIRPAGWILSILFGLGITAASMGVRPSVAAYPLLPHSHTHALRSSAPRAVIAESRFISQHYRVPPSRARKIARVAFRVSKEHRLDPYLVLAIIAVESSFRPHVVNVRGRAYGLMQIVPRVHAQRVAAEGGLRRLYLIVPNIRIGVLILVEYGARSQERLRHALWRYSGGEHGYARKVLKLREALVRSANTVDFATAG